MPRVAAAATFCCYPHPSCCHAAAATVIAAVDAGLHTKSQKWQREELAGPEYGRSDVASEVHRVQPVCKRRSSRVRSLRINARPRIQKAEAAGSGAADSKLIQRDAGRRSSVELDSAVPQHFQPFTLQGRQ